VFDWRSVGDGDTEKIGDIALKFSRTDHPPPTYAVEARADGRRLVYTADTGPGWTIGAFEPEADLVLSEATYLDGHVPVPIHLSAKQAGTAAREARAQRLILTHLWPLNDPDEVAKEGAEAYGGEVTVAVPRLSTEV
jgi:ribonuclease BN (tRNA processing enzyme)